MSEFTDGLRDPDYEGKPDDYLPLDMLDPSVAFDIPEELEAVADQYPSRITHGISKNTIKDLRENAESDDPNIAALGHLGLATLAHSKRVSTARKRAQAGEIIPPTLFGVADEPDHFAYTAGKRYIAVRRVLASSKYDEGKGSLSGYLMMRIRSIMQAESFGHPLVSLGDRKAFGITADRLSSLYDNGYLDPDDDIISQATGFYTYYTKCSPDFIYPKLSDGEVADGDRLNRFAALRNVLLQPMGEPLMDDFDMEDPYSGVAFDEAEDRVVAENQYAIIVELLSTPLLNEHQQQVVRMRFGLDGQKPMTLQAIGESLDGVTREAVRQTLARAIKKLRRASGIKNSEL